MRSPPSSPCFSACTRSSRESNSRSATARRIPNSSSSCRCSSSPPSRSCRFSSPRASLSDKSASSPARSAATSSPPWGPAGSHSVPSGSLQSSRRAGRPRSTQSRFTCSHWEPKPSYSPEPSSLLAFIPLVWLLHVFSDERKERYTASLELHNAYRGTVMLLSDVVEAEDDYTAFHCRSVVELVAEVAEELNIPKSDRQELEFAALLHDVGKISIPKE